MTAESAAVVAGLQAWADGDFARLAQVLHPNVKLLASEAGPWDCHGRDVVIGLLEQRRAEGRQPFEVHIDEIDDSTLVISRAAHHSDDDASDHAGEGHDHDHEHDHHEHEHDDDHDSEDQHAGGATVVTIRDGVVVLMRQYPSRHAALAAIA